VKKDVTSEEKEARRRRERRTARQSAMEERWCERERRNGRTKTKRGLHRLTTDGRTTQTKEERKKERRRDV